MKLQQDLAINSMALLNVQPGTWGLPGTLFFPNQFFRILKNAFKHRKLTLCTVLLQISILYSIEITLSRLFNLEGACRNLLHMDKTPAPSILPSDICCRWGEDVTVQEGAVTHDRGVVFPIRGQYQGGNICRRECKVSTLHFGTGNVNIGPASSPFPARVKGWRV